ncbi:uncharacterized protein LOC134190595 isoform X2 [Corticium candelabrum]|uniref:uncharacterized protein LOC134190595 isoform X2 n=1 Tax=Corticium candelabrum TaxID=121492 RepID=UPI002E26A3EB|nr:uncharacterized protein LOC134190595 isoform X2 [Corticium candelabrum]
MIKRRDSEHRRNSRGWKETLVTLKLQNVANRGRDLHMTEKTLRCLPPRQTVSFGSGKGTPFLSVDAWKSSLSSNSCNHCSFSSTVSCVSGESERADFHRNMLFLAPFKQSRHQMFRQRRPYSCSVSASHSYQQNVLKQSLTPVKGGPFLDQTWTQNRPKTGRLLSGKLRPLLGRCGWPKPRIDHCVGILSSTLMTSETRELTHQQPVSHHYRSDSRNLLRPPPSSRATSPLN